MNSSPSSRPAPLSPEEKRITRAQRRKEQERKKKALQRFRRAEVTLVLSMAALCILSLLLCVDTHLGGVISILLPIAQIIPLVLLYRFNGLWKKRSGEFFITEGCSAVFLLLGLIENHRCTPIYPFGWILTLWLVPLAAWLLLIWVHHGTSRKGLIFSVLMAASLFSFAFFWTENANAALDRRPTTTVHARVMDYEQQRTGRGGVNSRIKLSFAYDSRSTVTYWFSVQNIDKYYRLTARTQIPIERHVGALGAAWYELDLQ